MKRLAVFFAIFLGANMGLGAPVVHADDLVLTIDGRAFKVNGTAKFLVFVSYFDAFDVSNANLASDFAALKSRGVDGVRIFPNWWGLNSPAPSTKYYAQDTLIDTDGYLRSGPLDKFLDILDIAKSEGLLVDVTFSAESVGYCPGDDCVAFSPAIGSLTKAELIAALEDLTDVLADAGSAYKHVLFDLQNEVDIVGPSDGILDDTDVDEVAEAVHAIDPYRIVTVSLSGGTSAEGAAEFANWAEVDVAAWHEERVSSWWDSTDDRVADMRATTGKPVYLQEPAPYGDAAWTLSGVSANVQAAKSSGASAWCFHTRSSFYLNGTSLWSSLASVEEDFLDDLATLLAAVSWGI